MSGGIILFKIHLFKTGWEISTAALLKEIATLSLAMTQYYIIVYYCILKFQICL
jgi:hypothetical protein